MILIRNKAADFFLETAEKRVLSPADAWFNTDKYKQVSKHRKRGNFFMCKLLEVVNTKTANDYTTTAIASTVISATYRLEGKETEVSAEGHGLVLVVDGVQKDLLEGVSYDVNDSFVEIRNIRWDSTVCRCLIS